MVYRKGELSKASIDREWPHQLALPTEFVTGKNTIILQRFCRGLSVCPRHQRYWRDGVEHIAYCFKDRLEAQYLQVHFGGELVDPNNLGPWSRIRQRPGAASEAHLSC